MILAHSSPPSISSRSCAACGHAVSGSGCGHCPGSVRSRPDGPRITPGSGFFLFDMFEGFLEVFRAGVQLLTRPEFNGRLRGALVANVIAIPTAVAALWVGLHFLFSWASDKGWGPLAMLRGLPGWLDAILVTVLAILGVLMLLPVLVEAVIGPFLEPIADTNEKALGGERMHAVPIPWRRALARSAGFSARVVLLQIGVFVVSVTLSFCGFGLALAFLASSALAALVWFEIPFTRRDYPRAVRNRLLFANWARAFGFGLGFQVGLLVPLFNLLMLTPAAAIAVTTLFLRFDKHAADLQQVPPPPDGGA